MSLTLFKWQHDMTSVLIVILKSLLVDVLRGHICSLFGIIGVTDKCLEALSKSCSNKITTLDVNGCVGMKANSYLKLALYVTNYKC